jgi:hypothetical protein
MGAILFSPNSMVSQQMFQQDYNPLWGLRKLSTIQVISCTAFRESRKEGARKSGHAAF